MYSKILYTYAISCCRHRLNVITHFRCTPINYYIKIYFTLRVNENITSYSRHRRFNITHRVSIIIIIITNARNKTK